MKSLPFLTDCRHERWDHCFDGCLDCGRTARLMLAIEKHNKRTVSARAEKISGPASALPTGPKS